MSAVTSAGGRDGVPLSIVFIHGFLDSHAVWSPLIEQLGSVQRVHYALDLRGAGALREEGGPYTLAQAVVDVLNLIDKHQMARVVLVGHSMGAQIAELVAMTMPERVAALVLLTPVSFLAGTHLPAEAASFLRTSGGDAAAQREIRASFRAIFRSMKSNVLLTRKS